MLRPREIGGCPCRILTTRRPRASLFAISASRIADPTETRTRPRRGWAVRDVAKARSGHVHLPASLLLVRLYFELEPTDSESVRRDTILSETGLRRGPSRHRLSTRTEIALLPAVSVVGPRGFEPRTCGLRVRSKGAGQGLAWLVSSAFVSLDFPTFPVVSRSFTRMIRGRRSTLRCHFECTLARHLPARQCSRSTPGLSGELRVSGPRSPADSDSREAVSFGAAAAGTNVGRISGTRRTSLRTDDGASAPPHSQLRTSGRRSQPPTSTHEQRRREETARPRRSR